LRRSSQTSFGHLIATVAPGASCSAVSAVATAAASGRIGVTSRTTTDTSSASPDAATQLRP
jgi:hypothetical protein